MSQYFELCFSLYYFAENNPIIITIDKSINYGHICNFANYFIL